MRIAHLGNGTTAPLTRTSIEDKSSGGCIGFDSQIDYIIHGGFQHATTIRQKITSISSEEIYYEFWSQCLASIQTQLGSDNPFFKVDILIPKAYRRIALCVQCHKSNPKRVEILVSSRHADEKRVHKCNSVT